MAITYGFFNAQQSSGGSYDRTYDADQMSTYFEGLVSDGVYADVGDGLQVVASSGMTVQVKAGRAIINSKWVRNSAAMNITINAAHVTLNRYTAIVAKLDSSARTISIIAKDGANASSPVKPTPTRSGTVKELVLAYVYVGKGVASITQSNIEDARADGNVCGWVTGLIKQVDTSELFLQYQTAYEEQLQQMQDWQEEQQAQFDSWFSTLTSKLQVNTYIQKYRKAVETTTEQGVFNLDMSGYAYSASDVIMVNVNGIMLIQDHEWTIDTSKNPVQLHTSQGIEANNLVEITVLKSKIGQS